VDFAMNMWVSPVPRRERSIPISPIQPYSKITPYLYREPEMEVEQYPYYPERKAPSSVEPIHTYVVYNENKQKIWQFPSKGWFMQAYG
jgi:hypothetical protein